MRCSTRPNIDLSDTCTNTATHLLLWSMPDPHDLHAPRKRYTEPVCKPCGDLAYRRRPALKARVVPLHVHMPDSAFIEIVEGHRLVKDPKHEARCFDCGTTGSPTWFRFQTNGCPGRPESITVLRYTPEQLQSFDRPAEAARLWWDYAVDYLGMHVEDWRLVTDHAEFSAYFTFRDREYAVKYNLLDHRFGAVKLSNRGRPEPEIINPELDPYNQVVYHFRDLVSKYETTYFATYTPGRQDVILYAPEGQVSAVLRLAEVDSSGVPLAVATQAVCDAFGAIADITLRTRIYE